MIIFILFDISSICADQERLSVMMTPRYLYTETLSMDYHTKLEHKPVLHLSFMSTLTSITEEVTVRKGCKMIITFLSRQIRRLTNFRTLRRLLGVNVTSFNINKPWGVNHQPHHQICTPITLLGGPFYRNSWPIEQFLLFVSCLCTRNSHHGVRIRPASMGSDSLEHLLDVLPALAIASSV